MIVYDIILSTEAVKVTVIGLLQAAGIFALAPLLTGVMSKVKARTQKRVGASVVQPYYDLLKLLKKDEVVSEHASWVFSWAPWVVAASTMTAALFVPVFVPFSPISSAGDILVVLGLFALARFFTMLAGIDTATAFGGIGVSREMMMSSLAEPGLFLTVFVVSLTFGGTNLTSLVGAAAVSGVTIAPSLLFGLIAFFIITLAEMGRLPFDNPATHLELTMVHEAMVLEYAGPDLALVKLGQSMRLVVLLALFADLFVPWGIATSPGPGHLAVGLVTTVAKVAGLGAALAILEVTVAKLRLFRVPELLAGAFVLSVLAVVSALVAT